MLDVVPHRFIDILTAASNALYRTSDRLVQYRDEIEERLVRREGALFQLGEKIITNTYLMGTGHNPEEDLRVVKQDKDFTVEIKRLDSEGEVTVYCQSTARAQKEQSMKARF